MLKISLHTGHLTFSSHLIGGSHINISCNGFADLLLLTVQNHSKMEKTWFYNADTILVWGRKHICLQFYIFISAFFLTFLQNRGNKNRFHVSSVKDPVHKKSVGRICTRQAVNYIRLTAWVPFNTNWSVTDRSMMRISTVCGTITNKQLCKYSKIIPEWKLKKKKHDFTWTILHC